MRLSLAAPSEDSWDEFRALTDLTTLKIELLNKFPTTRALESAFRKRDARKAMAAVLDKFSIVKQDGTALSDMMEFRSCLTPMNDGLFSMLNEATSDEHEMQHFLDLVGTTAGLYLSTFFLQRLKSDVHFLNRLSVYESVRLPLMGWLESPDEGTSKDPLRRYIRQRNIGLQSMTTTQLVKIPAESLRNRPNGELFVRYKNQQINSPYFLPHVALFASSDSPCLVPINFIALIECKGLLKQLAILAKFLGPTWAGMFLMFLASNLPRNATYLAPLIPYLHWIGLHEGDPILKELTSGNQTAVWGVSPQAASIAISFSLRLAQDYDSLYDLCDWALMGDSSRFTNDASVDEQRVHYLEFDPGCRFAKAMEASLAGEPPSPGTSGDMYSAKFTLQEEYRNYDMAGQEFALEFLGSIDSIKSDDAIAELTRLRYKILQRLGVGLFSKRMAAKGKLVESTSTLYDLIEVVGSGNLVILQKRDRQLIIPAHCDVSHEVLMHSINVPAYITRMLSDLLHKDKVSCPWIACAGAGRCNKGIVPAPSSNGVCLFGSYAQELLGDVKFAPSLLPSG